jgi:hypothetical protein
MSATSTQSKVPASAVNIALGRYIDTGTAAAFVITVGFKPRYVRVQNLAATGARVEWYEGMADASAWKTVVAGDQSLITTLGITVSASGFTVGLDTDVNVTSEQLSWLAIG